MVNKKKAQTEYEKVKKLSLDDIENEMESIAMDQGNVREGSKFQNQENAT